MNASDLNAELENIDLYLLDQILKGRMIPEAKILDAGFGGGRNSFWFLKNGFNVLGVDQNEEAVLAFRQQVAERKYSNDQFIVGDLINLPYANGFFDVVICNAVLHFAQSHAHFQKMFSELIRILKSSGILFIRMTSNIGIADKIKQGKEGVSLLPDESYRFLLTRELLADLMMTHKLEFLEPLKTVNVNDVRCMSTLVLKKR